MIDEPDDGFVGVYPPSVNIAAGVPDNVVPRAGSSSSARKYLPDGKMSGQGIRDTSFAFNRVHSRLRRSALQPLPELPYGIFRTHDQHLDATVR
jgi:hypothetical protein